MTTVSVLALFAAAVAAGAVNSIAGGGTLLTFPSLLAAGVSPIVANATSTIALVPGAVTAFRGYRGQMQNDRRLIWLVAVPSLVGGGVGAGLVLLTGDALFKRMVPWLILVAVVMFVVQPPLKRWLRRGAPEHREGGDAALVVSQFAVSIYGGFFGAGMGIMMLAAYGLLGLSGIHRMNGLKSIAAVCINGLAAATFIYFGKVDWPLALIMALGSTAGGYLGAWMAQKVSETQVRGAVVVVGSLSAVVMFWQSQSPH